MSAFASGRLDALYSVADGLLFREIRQIRDPNTIVAFGWAPQACVTRAQAEAAVALTETTPLLADRIRAAGGALRGAPRGSIRPLMLRDV
jgi:hypothetical protein